MRTLAASTALDRRGASRPTADLTNAALTAEGRCLLELKAAELRAVSVPALLRAVAADVHDRQTREAYDDKLDQLLRLESLLAAASPIPAPCGGSGQVGLGDLITVEFLSAAWSDVTATNEASLVEQFRLVHPVEAPLDLVRISMLSPLGQAVLGKRVGDLVEVDAPAGRLVVRVIATDRPE